jgi:hypothetical protein
MEPLPPFTEQSSPEKDKQRKKGNKGRKCRRK